MYFIQLGGELQPRTSRWYERWESSPNIDEYLRTRPYLEDVTICDSARHCHSPCN